MTDKGVFLFAEDERAFERLYSEMKKEFMKLFKKISEAEKQKGRHLTEKEMEDIIREWLEEVDSNGQA